MTGLVRRAASNMLAAASRMLPESLRPWARAMERELAETGDDGRALLFALGCLRAILGLAISARLRTFAAAARILVRPLMSSGWSLSMISHVFARPRLLGLICGAAAAAIGIAYMAAAGAPKSYLVVNLAASILGASAWMALTRTAGSGPRAGGAAILALAIPLLGTALLGAASGGASRWLSIGQLNLQTSLIVLPIMIVLYARRPDRIGTAGLIAAALALAIQPDRAMAGVLLAALLALVMATRSGLAAAAAAASLLGFGWTLLEPDSLTAVPYVDQILFTAFDLDPLAGLAVLAGAAALIGPAIIAASRRAAERETLLAFGACWLAIVAAAALGNYPTPLVGYGGSAVLGYFLSAALLPSRSWRAAANRATGSSAIAERGPDPSVSELHLA